MKLAALASVNDGSFVSELRKADRSLKPEDASEFFEILCGHLRTIQDLEIASEIYLAIEKVISQKKFLDVFVSGNFLNRLPFTRKAHFEMLLDVVYTVVDRAPNAFDADFAEKFQGIIRHRGRKCLIVLAMYARHFNNLQDPWPMLDLLFYEEERFTVIDVVCQYVSLLSLLCQSFPDFRRSRGENCWDVITGVLEREDTDEVLAACWEAVTGIESFEHTHAIDYKLLQRQFAHAELRSSILSFMIVSPLVGFVADAKFVGNLLKAAKKDTRAGLVLMKLAKGDGVSGMLSEDTAWMALGLPNVIDTLRIMLVVFSHPAAKDAIRQAPELVQLLNSLNKVRARAMTTLLAVVVRRLELEEEAIKELSESGFFTRFFERGDSLKDVVLMAETVARVCFVHELYGPCETLKEVLETESDEFDVMCLAGMRLAKHKKLKAKMIKAGIPAVLAKRAKVVETAKMSKKFLAKLE